MSQPLAPSPAQRKYALQATLENVKILAQLLRAIHFRDTSTWFISENGIKVTVEDAKSVQANAFIKAEIFQEFLLAPPSTPAPDSQPPDLSFSLNLGVVLECLNMFGGVGIGGDTASPTLKLCYGGYGEPLVLLLEDQGVVTDCAVRTREAEECLDFNFTTSSITSKVIIVSEYLRDVFSELDYTSEYIEFLVSPSPPALQLRTSGAAGDCTVTIPESSDMAEHFKCSQPAAARYRLNLLKHGIKPLSLSEKISVRIDSRDFLCLQYMVRTDQGPAFLEFYSAPEEESPER